MAKETVQNILLLRFANSIFEPLWNRNYIKFVRINASESLGVGSRAGFYEQAGVVRDMVQNHMMQLLTLVAHRALPPGWTPTGCATNRRISSRPCVRYPWTACTAS